MKKLMFLIIAIVALGLIVSGCLPVVPPAEKDEATILTKQRPDLQPGLNFNGPHYNLNLIGKKVDWNGGGSFDNPNRHTMFVPEDTSDFGMWIPQKVHGVIVDVWVPGLTIWMTQGVEGDEFEVIDGTAFGEVNASCSFQLAPGYYQVVIAAKGKPNKITDITSYGWYYDEDLLDYYYRNLGNVKVSHNKKPVWKDVTDLFMIDDLWIFDYINSLMLDPEVKDKAYFWQLVNGGKLIQVRFYPILKSELPK